jgi:hypothetical protein
MMVVMMRRVPHWMMVTVVGVGESHGRRQDGDGAEHENEFLHESFLSAMGFA